MPLSRKAGPISRTSRLKNFKMIMPLAGIPDFSPSPLWLMELLNTDKGPPLLNVAPTRPGMAADNASVAPSVMMVDSTSSTGLPSRKMVWILSDKYSGSTPN